MTLLDLETGKKGFITKVKGRGAFRKRIMEMGFLTGKEITVVKKAPLRDPVEYNIMGYNVSLRNSEAAFIEIISETESTQGKKQPSAESFSGEYVKNHLLQFDKVINVAFVGNPNSGKTTIFNYASGAKERVGNYSGVTVEAKDARFRLQDYTFNVTDLPGTYSISAYSPEELFVRDFISQNMPDVVVNVVDASNLERNLYLTTQLIDMDIKVVVALNMYDELTNSGNKLNHNYLGKLLGIPFVPTVGSRGKGIDDLLQKIIEVHEDREKTARHIHIHYGNVLENSIRNIQEQVKKPCNQPLIDTISSRFLALKLLEKDKQTQHIIENSTNNAGEILKIAEKERKRIVNDLNEEPETLITDAKYGFIAGALRETLQTSREAKVSRSEIIDIFITHKIWGIPIFIAFMWLTFYFTFRLGIYPQQWIEASVDYISGILQQYMQPGMLKDLFIQGIISGVGGVIVFMPNIILLYLFISLMEDTGYMARAVFIMDKAMHKIGLHGKSFIPLVMGFGCNVPAILSTRIIESRRDRMITMLINPFMSCSARLPVFILIISAFFSQYQASILFSIYLIGISIAVLSALLFRKTLLRKEDIPFVMELPPYRLPTLRSIIKHMWYRVEQYLRKIGGVVLMASIIIWALGYFPRNSSGKNAQESSYICQIGKFIEPAMQPLGFDWKTSVSILSGIAAKEVVVGTLSVLHNHNGEPENASLVKKLQDDTYSYGPRKGEKVFSPLVAYSFMLFILIYFPCIAVIAAIRKESGSWRWALFTVFYNTSIAWLVAFIVYQAGKLFM